MSIKNVVVVGASGNLGPAIVSALAAASFNVTILTRTTSTTTTTSSTPTYPPTVTTKQTDYTPASLATVLAGQDAVISTIATGAIDTQTKIIDAAVAAGIKRFIPSEFGLNTQKATGGPAKILAKKVQTQELLDRAAGNNSYFSWTGLSTNLFFDWGLKVGSLGFNIPYKTALIWDSGNEPFTATNLPTIGRAIVAILQHPQQTANRYLDIASFTTTQNEVLKLLEEESSAKWTVTKGNTSESTKMADEKLAKGDYSAFSDYLKAHLYADGKGQSAKKTELANEELGVPFDDLRATLKAALALEKYSG